MPFKKIMGNLIESIPGATGAIFLDWEGEAVDQYAVENDTYQLKVLGAHKGVILGLINDAQAIDEKNKVECVSIKMKNFSVIMAPVSDEYFVVLTLKPDSSISKARYGIRHTAKALMAEI